MRFVFFTLLLLAICSESALLPVPEGYTQKTLADFPGSADSSMDVYTSNDGADKIFVISAPPAQSDDDKRKYLMGFLHSAKQQKGSSLDVSTGTVRGYPSATVYYEYQHPDVEGYFRSKNVSIFTPSKSVSIILLKHSSSVSNLEIEPLLTGLCFSDTKVNFDKDTGVMKNSVKIGYVVGIVFPLLLLVIVGAGIRKNMQNKTQHHKSDRAGELED